MKKKSFISNHINQDLYDELGSHAKLIVGIGTAILMVLFPLTHVCYSMHLCKWFTCCTGYSILFIIYIAAFIVLLDIQVDVPDSDSNSRSLYMQSKERTSVKGIPHYRLTMYWGFLLIAMGVAAIYYTNKERRHYAFQCSEFFVEKKTGICHIFDDCEDIKDESKLVKMKGYEAEKHGYKLCEPCKEYYEDISP